MKRYRDMVQAAFDAAYNNTVAVAESANLITDWNGRSSALAAERPQHLDMRYGPRERTAPANCLSFSGSSRIRTGVDEIRPHMSWQSQPGPALAWPRRKRRAA